MRSVQSPAVFPAFVGQCSVQFDTAQTARSEAPDLVLPGSIARAHPRRQAEFIAGRYCARAALAALGYAPIGEIGIGPDREPLWPSGIVGAITHAGGYASVAVARSVDTEGIGLDVEELISEDVASQVCDMVAARDEIANVCRVTGWAMHVVLTLIFSAKESLFKCVYPHVRRYFEFRDAVVSSVDVSSGRISILLACALSAEFPAGRELHGQFERGTTSMATGVTLPVGGA